MDDLIRIGVGVSLLGLAAAILLFRRTLRKGAELLMRLALSWTSREPGIWPTVSVYWTAGILSAGGLLVLTEGFTR